MYMHTWLLWSNKPCVAVRGAGLELHVRPNLSDSVAERQLPPLALVKVNEMIGSCSDVARRHITSRDIKAATTITLTLSNLVSPAAAAFLTGAFMVLASDDMAVDALPTVVTLGLHAREAQ